MSAQWTAWADAKPKDGDKFAVAHSDGCSSGLYMMVDGRALNAEDAFDSTDFLDGCIWALLPETYSVRFTEVTTDDWY